MTFFLFFCNRIHVSCTRRARTLDLRLGVLRKPLRERTQSKRGGLPKFGRALSGSRESCIGVTALMEKMRQRVVTMYVELLVGSSQCDATAWTINLVCRASGRFVSVLRQFASISTAAHQIYWSCCVAVVVRAKWNRFG